MSGHRNQFVEPHCSAPFVRRANVVTCQLDLPIDVSHSLNARMGGAIGAVGAQETRHSVTDRACGIFLQRGSFDLHRMDSASERPGTCATFPEEAGDAAFHVNPVSSVSSLHGASTIPGLLGHAPCDETACLVIGGTPSHGFRTQEPKLRVSQTKRMLAESRRGEGEETETNKELLEMK